MLKVQYPEEHTASWAMLGDLPGAYRKVRSGRPHMPGLAAEEATRQHVLKDDGKGVAAPSRWLGQAVHTSTDRGAQRSAKQCIRQRPRTLERPALASSLDGKGIHSDQSNGL
jgi:hypothetical protein